MDKKYKVLIFIALLVYIIYHLITLIYSPVPWFDEVSLAAISESYAKNHTFFETNRQIVLPDQKLVYGPLFFMLQAFVIKTFGFHIFTIRFSALLFGLIDLFLVYKICDHFKFKNAATVLTLLLIALEPNFNQFLHSGRMDFQTLFFFLLSYLVFVKADPAKRLNYILYAAFTGVLLACAVLTTPRIIFTFAFYVFAFVYELVDKRYKAADTFLKYIVLAIGFVAIYYLWIYSAYGNISGYIYYNTHSSVIKDHVGVDAADAFSFRKLLKYNTLLYTFGFLLFFIVLIKKAVAKNIELILFTVPVIFAFLLIVGGGLFGRYFALVMPFLSILIAGISIDRLDSKLLKGATWFLVGMFGVIFVFKAAFILSSLQQRDPYYNESLITPYLDKNSSVVGDFQYYYIARNKNCSFISLEENGEYENKMNYFFDHKMAYFIINTNNGNMQYYEQKLLAHNYRLVASIDPGNATGFFHKVIMELPYKITEGYACRIYKSTGQ